MTALNERVGREWKRLVRQVRWAFAPDTPETRRKHWEKEDQPFELKFHQGHNYRWDDNEFFAQWQELFGEFCGYQKDHFGAEHVMLDLGCGSRPVFDWFNGEAEQFFLDPLLSDYCEIEKMNVHWCEKPSHTLLSIPAEIIHESLASRCDFVNCWNVLDHTYDWRQILENIRDYAKPGGEVLLGTDFESHGLGHPGIDDRAFFDTFVAEHFETIRRAENFVNRELALFLRRR